jgi:hypothetical protein
MVSVGFVQERVVDRICEIRWYAGVSFAVSNCAVKLSQRACR